MKFKNPNLLRFSMSDVMNYLIVTNRVRMIPVLGIGRYLQVSLLGDTVFGTRTRYFHSRYRQPPPRVQ